MLLQIDYANIRRWVQSGAIKPLHDSLDDLGAGCEI